jgi:hypothetical protein
MVLFNLERNSFYYHSRKHLLDPEPTLRTRVLTMTTTALHLLAK